jgi:predicted dehydrogenase
MLGSAPTVSVDLAWWRDAAYFRKRAAWGCGALLSVGIHALDAVCYALDRPVLGVACTLGPRVADTRVPDAGVAPAADDETSAVLSANFRGGAAMALRLTLEGGPDETRLSFCGAGVTGAIVGSEADPTASTVLWSCENDATLQRLRALEDSTDGSVQAPLIVPYIGRALAAWRGRRSRRSVPVECDELLSVRDVVCAHDLAMRAYESASVR